VSTPASSHAVTVSAVHRQDPGQWQACAATRAHLLRRVKSDICLPVRQPLPDGSWLTAVNGTREAHLRNMRNANRRSRGSRLPQEEGPLPGDVTVRVIEFLITLACEDGTTRTERYRAVTTLLDWHRYPAAGLAAAYARRWESSPPTARPSPTRPYPARNGKPQPLPQATYYTLTITPPGTPTRQHHDQQQQATSLVATPP
jgi:hypothetical protein